MSEPIVEVKNLHVEFPIGGGQKVHAVSGVDLELFPGETVGLVGESGCGKSTLGRAMMQLVDAAAGSVHFDGRELTALTGDDLRRARRRMQIIFQDPVSSLNPSRRIADILREGPTIWPELVKDQADLDRRVSAVMEAVGLPERTASRRPHEFSGGQCQRISIARALMLDPSVLILDEPVSALDVSVQAQILNLLEELKARFALTMLFISHDLSVVKNVSDRVVVMYLGSVVEVTSTDSLFDHPLHPYSRALLASIPGADLGLPPARYLISGELPSPVNPPSGCRFRTRCPVAEERCAREVPELIEVVPGHHVACHYVEQAMAAPPGVQSVRIGA